MKLVIQIPCYNEAKTLPAVVRDLPRQVAGFDAVEFLVVDDGSSDGTAEIATSLGVDHVLRLGSNRGLATAFTRGIDEALRLGADVVVNTDGDNQYCGADVERLVAPLLENRADMVIGCRPIVDHPEFGRLKKALQLLGSFTLRRISMTEARDAASGFRAFSREACQRLYLHSRFSHCMESLIQAGANGLRVASVDVRVNPATRPSRLFGSTLQYLYRSTATIVAMFVLYRPGRFFTWLASPFLTIALGLGLRFLYLVYWTADARYGRTYLPSLILLAVCSVVGFLLLALGILGELTKAQRRLAEEQVYLLRKTTPPGASSA